MLKLAIKNFIANCFGLFHVYPAVLTDPRRIENLIQHLHPVTVDKPLIRLGPPGDGGYLVPNDLSAISTCFSPGVNTISGFELDCAKLGIETFMADKSVNGPAATSPFFRFIKKNIGPVANDNDLTLDSWVTQSLPNDGKSDLMLQMDIEGCEYEVLFSASQEVLKRFRIMVVEFHGLHLLWDSSFFALAQTVFNKLLQSHTCVHIHPNNAGALAAVTLRGIKIPRLMEFTFYRRDRFVSSGPQTTFPHELDHDCTRNSSLVLPECWYGNPRK